MFHAPLFSFFFYHLCSAIALAHNRGTKLWSWPWWLLLTAKMATATTSITITSTTPTVAFTTPPIYAGRLAHLLTVKGFNPLSSPTLIVQYTPSTTSALKPYLSPPSLDLFSAIAFPSRTAIAAFSAAADDIAPPLLSADGEAFTVAALGKDSELIDDNFVRKLCQDRRRVRILIPPIATPTGLVQSLGDGGCRRLGGCCVQYRSCWDWRSLRWYRIFSGSSEPATGLWSN